MKKRILVTGAAGRVARIFMDATRDRYDFVCFDRRPAPDVSGLIVADLTDLAALERAASGCAALLHLGAHPDHHPDFPGVLVPSNITGLWNAFAAAARAKVPRVVFASTVQVEFGWPEGTLVSVTMPAKPKNYYSGGKLLGEHLGFLFARDRGLSVVCLRLGGVILPEREVEMIEHGEIPENIAVFSRDLVAIISRALDWQETGYVVLPCYSRNAAAIKDLAPLQQVLDYEPVEDARARPVPVEDPAKPARKAVREFRNALRWGRLEEVRRLVTADARLAAEGGDHLDLLLAAADPAPAPFAARLAADAGVATVASRDGITALHVAGHPDTARALLAAGADPLARDQHRRQTPLAWSLDRPEVARVLADRLGPPTIHLACALGDVALATRLLDADPALANAPAPEDTPFFRGIPPLHLACQQGRTEIVKLLLARGADPATYNQWGGTALHTAAWRGQLDILRALLDGGARPDQRDGEWGGTAREWAEESKKPEAVALLQAAEASPAALAAARAAAPGGPPVVWRTPASREASFPELVEADVLGTWRALEAARAAKASSFTFETDADVYAGWPAGTPLDPERTPRRPASEWAAIQSFLEILVTTYGQRMGLAVAVRRPVSRRG